MKLSIKVVLLMTALLFSINLVTTAYAAEDTTTVVIIKRVRKVTWKENITTITQPSKVPTAVGTGTGATIGYLWIGGPLAIMAGAGVGYLAGKDVAGKPTSITQTTDIIAYRIKLSNGEEVFTKQLYKRGQKVSLDDIEQVYPPAGITVTEIK